MRTFICTMDFGKTRFPLKKGKLTEIKIITFGETP